MPGKNSGKFVKFQDAGKNVSITKKPFWNFKKYQKNILKVKNCQKEISGNFQKPGKYSGKLNCDRKNLKVGNNHDKFLGSIKMPRIKSGMFL